MADTYKNYAKLINSKKIEYAPSVYEMEEEPHTQYIPPSVALCKELGYKKVVMTPYPTDGKSYEIVYSETKTEIHNTWEEIPEPPEPPTPLNPTLESLQADMEFLMIMGGYSDLDELGDEDLEGLEEGAEGAEGEE